MSDNSLEILRARMESKSLYELRQVGRRVGVHRATDGKKEWLIEKLMGIATGEIKPITRTVRGAPPKSNDYDEALVRAIEQCRINHTAIDADDPVDDMEDVMEVRSSGIKTKKEEKILSGMLDFDGQNWLVGNYEFEVSKSGVIVRPDLVTTYHLQMGDIVIGYVTETDGFDKHEMLTSLISVNGLSPEAFRTIIRYEDSPLVFPKQKYELFDTGLLGKAVDVFCPICKGQRAMILSSAHEGKTTTIVELAKAVHLNYPNEFIMVCNIGSRPEEVAEMKEDLPFAQIITADINGQGEQQLHVLKLAVEFAKRKVEQGVNVVLFVDCLSRLIRSNLNLQQSDNNSNIVGKIKQIFSSAGALMDGKSLTMIATLNCQKDNELDKVVYEELSSMTNMEMVLSPDLCEHRIFPAIDLSKCYTKRENKILTEEQLKAISKIRLTAKDWSCQANILQKLYSAESVEAFLAEYK